MKKISLLLLLVFTFQVNAQTDFITKWYFPSSASSLEFGCLTAGGSVSYNLSTHPSGRSYLGIIMNTVAGAVTLSGLNISAGDTVILSMQPANLKRFYFQSGIGTDNDKLVDVSQWGTVNWTSMELAFINCKNLNITATDIPDLSAVSSMEAMFSGCSILNSPANIGSWNTASVKDMTAVFFGAKKFNQKINSWNTANVQSMSIMFGFAYAFNQDISSWNTANVKSMSSMFRKAYAFNQDISSWNTSKVTYMERMFYGAKKFNQAIGKWDVSMVTNLNGMFNTASDFNQNIGNWKFKVGLPQASNMLDSCGMDCHSYSATLIGWDTNNPVLSALKIDCKGMKYGTNALAARNNLIGSPRNWMFKGDQASGTDCSTLNQVNEINNDIKDINLFPNPFTNSLNIISENEHSLKLTLLQIDGRELAAFELPANSHLQYNTVELAPGVYLLQMKTKNGLVCTKKIVKSE